MDDYETLQPLKSPINSNGDIEYEIKKDEFERICRTCLAENAEGTSINDVVLENITLIWLLQKFISIQNVRSDYLPQRLCNNCVSKLIDFYQFERKCVENEEILQNVYNSNDGKLTTEVLVINLESASDSETDQSRVEKKVQIKNFKCRTCGVICASLALLRKHKREVKHPENKTLKPAANRKLRQRTRPHVKEKLYLCDICPEGFTISRNLKRHMTTHNAGNPHVCKICSTVFENIAELREHKKDAKHVENRICTECGKNVGSGKLKQHMRTRTKEKPYVCAVCSQGFSMSGNLKRHMMMHTGERPHVCEVCGKGFIQAASLANHKRTHFNREKSESNVTNFVCEYCGRNFKRLARYNTHLRRHFLTGGSTQKKVENEEPREYVCEKCKRAYRTKNLLKSHQLTHGEKKFLCSDCGKSFFTKAGLQSHLKVHTGEKPHTCNVCKKSFAHIGSFEAHMLIHTGVKPYACNVCKKTFTQLTHLKYHKRTHSGERPYVCSYCGKKFALKGNLKVHTRIHTGETPYMCPECGRGFYDSSSMKKHRRGHIEEKNDPSMGISEHGENNQNGSVSLQRGDSNLQGENNLNNKTNVCDNSLSNEKELIYIELINQDKDSVTHIQIPTSNITEYL